MYGMAKLPMGLWGYILSQIKPMGKDTPTYLPKPVVSKPIRGTLEYEN